jgi:hypothetical protein
MKLPKSVAGRITVRAVGAFRQSRVTAKPFKRLAPRASHLRTPKRCTVRRKRITCR